MEGGSQLFLFEHGLNGFPSILREIKENQPLGKAEREYLIVLCVVYFPTLFRLDVRVLWLLRAAAGRQGQPCRGVVCRSASSWHISSSGFRLRLPLLPVADIHERLKPLHWVSLILHSLINWLTNEVIELGLKPSIAYSICFSITQHPALVFPSCLTTPWCCNLLSSRSTVRGTTDNTSDIVLADIWGFILIKSQILR